MNIEEAVKPIVRDLVIGIDPGSKTGVAIKDMKTGEFIEVRTLKHHQAQALVLQFKIKHNVKVVFEDARLRDWFGREEQNLYNKIKLALFGKVRPKITKKDFDTWVSKVKMSGYIKDKCSLWEEFLKDQKIAYKAIKPKAGGTKLKAAFIFKLTGYAGRTSEHARDAMMLINGINKINYRMYFKI